MGWNTVGGGCVKKKKKKKKTEDEIDSPSSFPCRREGGVSVCVFPMGYAYTHESGRQHHNGCLVRCADWRRSRNIRCCDVGRRSLKHWVVLHAGVTLSRRRHAFSLPSETYNLMSNVQVGKPKA